jgi:hypothetical protein
LASLKSPVAVAAARRSGFVRCNFEPVGVGLCIWRGALRHGRFRVDWTPGMFSFFGAVRPSGQMEPSARLVLNVTGVTSMLVRK